MYYVESVEPLTVLALALAVALVPAHVMHISTTIESFIS